jgi:hypothetical protein
MSRKTQITLTDRQYALLWHESDRTGLPVAELVRRAIDTTFRPHKRRKVGGMFVSLGLWKEPDAAVVGRRPAGRRVVED